MCAPRTFASSRSSSSNDPAPSPSTKPSRVASNGRDTVARGSPGRGLPSPRMFPKPAWPTSRIGIGDLERCVGDCLLRGGNPVMQRRLAATCSLGVHPVGRHEVLDLAGGLLLVAAHVELGDLTEAGTAVHEVVPGRPLVVADGA